MAKAIHSSGLRGRKPGAVAVALLLAAAACGGSNDDSTGVDGMNAEQLRGAGTLAQVSPLTGEVAEDGLPDHPVLAVKIDNTSSSSPQLGLDDADLIVEELVEGGLTRLAVLFYAQVPTEVGPVRSMRASDIGILKPADATLVVSGGAPPTIRRLAGADVPTITEATPGAIGYARDSGRTAPYNLMMHLSELVNTLPGADSGTVPSPYLPFGSDADFSGDAPAGSIAATFSTGHTTTWTYGKGGYLRPDSFAEQSHDFVADNVLVLRVKVGNAGYRDPAGNPVPETIFDGTGSALLFHDGQVVTGTWHKDGLGAGVQLTGKDGAAMTVPAGHTWIELVPVDTGAVTYTR